MSLAASLEHLAQSKWFHFLILEGGLLVILIGCIIFLSPFLDVVRRTTIECFPYDPYDL